MEAYPPIMEAYPPIKDYAVIGDCGSAALVSRDGSLDWLCLPVFDSPSVFAALLDAKKGGRFRIRPTGAYRTERRYVDGTNVLETTFTTNGGVLRLTDLMPVIAREDVDVPFRPDHEVLRQIACVEGEVEVDIHVEPRLEYGLVKPRFKKRGRLGYFYNHRSSVYVVHSDVPLELHEEGGTLRGRTTLRGGDVRYVSLGFDIDEPAILSTLGEHAAKRIDETIEFWRDWISQCSYEGAFEADVKRSALTLKLMTFSRSGAVIAAPTTSLPEKIGGVRNWDYRYCWLRDASFTLRALFELGYDVEGSSFFYWLIHAAAGTQPYLKVLYDVYGGTHVGEKTLNHLEGYRGSSPVRVGNDAKDQLQLDVYGQLVGAVYEFVKRGGELNFAHRHILGRLADTVCEQWHLPDEGMWEIRGEPRHHTYSKVMCWEALDRLIEMHDHDIIEIDREHLSAVRAEIRDTIESRAYNGELGSYVSVLDGDEVDANLLLLPAYGYVDPHDPRMRGTYDLVEKRLARGPLTYRYSTHDGLPPGEGAFGICSFWGEAYLARIGKIDEAKADFEATLAYANDVGLFAEEIDPDSGAALGNFPQAFTHVGLINAALTIAEAEGRKSKSGTEETLDTMRPDESLGRDVARSQSAA